VPTTQVCNHPELFERADVVAPFSFSRFGRPGPLSREGDFVTLPYSTRNPIEYPVPELLYHDGGLLDVPSQRSEGLSSSACLKKLFNIWSTDWLQRSLYDEGEVHPLTCLNNFIDFIPADSSFAFLRLLDLSPGEAHSLHVMPLITRQLIAVEEEAKMIQDSPYSLYVHLTTCLDELLTRPYQRSVICGTHSVQYISHQRFTSFDLLGYRRELTGPPFAIYNCLGSVLFIPPRIEMVCATSSCSSHIIVLHG
jgi:hypothetical protein